MDVSHGSSRTGISHPRWSNIAAVVGEHVVVVRGAGKGMLVHRVVKDGDFSEKLHVEEWMLKENNPMLNNVISSNVRLTESSLDHVPIDTVD